MKNTVFLYTLSFIFLILMGAAGSEYIRLQFAKSLNYTERYAQGFARYIFSSPEIEAQFDRVMEQYDNQRLLYTASEEWKELVVLDQRNRVYIELASKAIIFFVSLLGLLLFLYFRRIEYRFSYRQFWSFLLSLFFMRDIVINLVGVLFGGLLCNEAVVWTYFDLPVIPCSRVSAGLGLVYALFLIYLVPKESRLPLVVSGIVGTMISLGLWVLIFGRLLLA